MHHNRRQHSRVAIPFFVTVLHDDCTVYGSTVDISLSGLFVECSELDKDKLPVGTKCDIIIELNNRKNINIPIVGTCEIVRHGVNGIGMKVRYISPSDSELTMHNIILYHCENIKRVSTESSVSTA